MWDEWTTNPGLLVVVVVMSSISSIHSFCVCICVWIMRCHYYRWLCRPKQRGHCFMWNQSCGGACLVDSFQDFHHAPLPICLSPSITHHHSLTPPPIIFLCILLACLQISKKNKIKNHYHLIFKRWFSSYLFGFENPIQMSEIEILHWINLRVAWTDFLKGKK